MTRAYTPLSRPDKSHDYRTHERHYQRWVDIIKRCSDPKAAAYSDYGGRGISVHTPWLDFWVFNETIERVLGPMPAGATLDRINNDGNYEPGNVRWASKTEQALNRRVRMDSPYGVPGLVYNKTRHRFTGIVNRFKLRKTFSHKCPLVVTQKLQQWQQNATTPEAWYQFWGVKYNTSESP